MRDTQHRTVSRPSALNRHGPSNTSDSEGRNNRFINSSVRAGWRAINRIEYCLYYSIRRTSARNRCKPFTHRLADSWPSGAACVRHRAWPGCGSAQPARSPGSAAIAPEAVARPLPEDAKTSALRQLRFGTNRPAGGGMWCRLRGHLQSSPRPRWIDGIVCLHCDHQRDKSHARAG